MRKNSSRDKVSALTVVVKWGEVICILCTAQPAIAAHAYLCCCLDGAQRRRPIRQVALSPLPAGTLEFANVTQLDDKSSEHLHLVFLSHFEITVTVSDFPYLALRKVL